MSGIRRLAVIGVAVVLVFLLFSIPAHATNGTGGDWEFDVIPYMWFMAMDGNVNVRGQRASVHESMSDVIKETDFAAMVHLEARKGRWGFFIDPMYSYFTSDGSVGPVDVKVKTDWWLVGLGGFYRLTEWQGGGEANQQGFLDVILGGRYWSVDNKIDVDVPMMGVVSVKKSTDWVDPFVGLRLRAYLTKKFFIDARGDIGGANAFGSSSYFTWNAHAGVGYHLSKNTALWAGYRALYVNRANGHGDNRFSWNVTLYGPLFAVGFRF